MLQAGDALGHFQAELEGWGRVGLDALNGLG